MAHHRRLSASTLRALRVSVALCQPPLLLEALEGTVAGGVVGDVVLPAAPDDLGPGSGEDAFGVGVALAVGAEAVVALPGPFVAVACVASEVAQGVAESGVATPPEGDGAVAA